MHPTDAELVAAALRGDQTGIAGMYGRYADRLHNYAWSVCRSHADAADIVQDTFVTGSQRLGQLRDPERLRPWLYAIARHHALRVIEQRKRVEVDSEIDMIIDFPQPDSGLDAQQLVWSAAAGLDAKDRDILTLHLREGLDGEDLAAALGVKPNAANVALFRVRERLEHAVGALLLTRFAPGACADLDALMDGELTPLVRKRATRHIERCDDCQDSRRRIGSPEALFAAMPAALAPAALRESVLSSWGTASLSFDAEIESWQADGFPDGSTLVPDAVPARSGATAGARTVQRARLAAVGGIVAVVVGAGLFAALRPAPDTVTQGASAAELAASPTTEPGPPGTALAVVPSSTIGATTLVALDDIATTLPGVPGASPVAEPAGPRTEQPPTSPTTVPDTAITAPTTAPDPTPATTDPGPAGPVFQPPANQGPDEFAAESVSLSVLEFDCGAVMTVRLRVTASSDPTVVVRYERGGNIVQDIELSESATEPNVYEGELEVFESNHRITARARAGSASTSKLLDEACNRIG